MRSSPINESHGQMNSTELINHSAESYRSNIDKSSFGPQAESVDIVDIDTMMARKKQRL